MYEEQKQLKLGNGTKQTKGKNPKMARTETVHNKEPIREFRANLLVHGLCKQYP
jgi:hypothetical protein